MNKKRLKGKGSFAKVSEKEALAEHKQYIDSQLIGCLQDGYRIQEMLHVSQFMEAEINFKLSQLGLNNKWEEVGKPKIVELYNGVLIPKSILIAQVKITIVRYRAQIQQIQLLKQKFLKEYLFKEEELQDVMTGGFDWNKYMASKKPSVETTK